MTWLTRLFFSSVAVGLASFSVASCVGGLTGGEVAQDAGVTQDAGGGDSVAPPAEGFVIALTPPHVTADPGDTPTPVTVTVRRAAGFDERITFQITGGVVGASASTPPDVEGPGATTTFTVGLMAGATAKGDHEFVVRGVAQGGKTATTALGLRAGSVLTPDAQGEIVVPAFATAVDVAAWGGGGGASAVGFGNRIAYPGGAGGFAGGRLPVTPGARLVVEVGGAGPVGAASSGGGGGGGYSGVRLGSDYLLIAGGGGGGSGAESGGPGVNVGAGGAGGGLKGGLGGSGCGGGGGGTETAGGAGGVCNGATFKAGAAGVAQKGGDAYNAKSYNTRAVGGGGAGGSLGGVGCGGGGGGAFGGGGGACDNGAGGGGGGSSMVISTAASAKRVVGSGANPPETAHPDYVAGVAAGGGVVIDPASASPGGPGRVVVRLVKP
ncbi:MAG: hypothetical protein JNL38_26400 [Myxococcales bacterium]|jgi:hypothetical protein|nr:hypothetical protein [Myxococcales bacterium]